MYIARQITAVTASFAVALCLALVGCSGGGSRSGGTQNNTQSPSLASLAMTPATSSIQTGGTQQYTVTGTDSNGNKQDVTSQVSWSISPANIASISKTGLATGLQGGSAKVSATLNSLNASASLSVIGLSSITVSPTGPAINIGGTQQFTAMATYTDGTQKDVTAQANWSTNPAGIATLSVSGLATGVAVGATNVIATLNSASGFTALDVTNSSHKNLELTGDYALSVAGSDSNGKWFMAGSIHFNGLGVIPSGTVDFINASGPLTSVAVTGTYNVLKDGRGSITLSSSNPAFPGHTFRFVLTTTQRVLPLVQFDQQPGMAGGSLERQTSPYVLAAANYVFRAAGSTSSKSDTAVVGLFTLDGNGNVTAGQEDINLSGGVNTHTLAASTYTSPSSIGRGTVTLTTSSSPAISYTFAYYMVANYKLVAVETDSQAVQGGVIELQQGQNFNNTLVVGPFVTLLDRAEMLGLFGMAGQWVLDGKGNITSGVQDEYSSGTMTNDITLNAGSTYACDLSGSGRGTVTEQTSAGTRDLVFYMVSKTKMYLLRTDSANQTEVGVGELQENPPFTPSSVSGIYGFGFAMLDPAQLSGSVGVLVSDGNGNMTGIEDEVLPGNDASIALGGTYTLANGGSTGRGTNNLTGLSVAAQVDSVFYVVSSSKFVNVQTAPVVDGAALLQ